MPAVQAYGGSSMVSTFSLLSHNQESFWHTFKNLQDFVLTVTLSNMIFARALRFNRARVNGVT